MALRYVAIILTLTAVGSAIFRSATVLRLGVNLEDSRPAKIARYPTCTPGVSIGSVGFLGTWDENGRL
jgi:hypothetical protein